MARRRLSHDWFHPISPLPERTRDRVVTHQAKRVPRQRTVASNGLRAIADGCCVKRRTFDAQGESAIPPACGISRPSGGRPSVPRSRRSAGWPSPAAIPTWPLLLSGSDPDVFALQIKRATTDNTETNGSHGLRDHRFPDRAVRLSVNSVVVPVRGWASDPRGSHVASRPEHSLDIPLDRYGTNPL